MRKMRLQQIDIIRGAALLGMILYHIIFDLIYFGVLPSNSVSQSSWQLFTTLIAGTFLILVGISLVLSFETLPKKMKQPQIIMKYSKRGLLILLYGMAISVMSYFFISETAFVRFGILHLIGTAVILMIPFLLHRAWLLWAALGTVLVTPFITNNSCIDALYPLGCQTSISAAVDYFPLFPWISFVFVGAYIAHVLKLHNDTLPASNHQALSFMAYLGRNSLIIYLIHQPIIYLIIALAIAAI